MIRDSLGIAQNIETGVLEIWDSNRPEKPYPRERFKNPSELSIEIHGGGVRLDITDSGKLGGQQETETTHIDNISDWMLFNPASEYADDETCIDIDLVLSYFALFSIDLKTINPELIETIEALILETKVALENTEYDTGNLFQHCNNHPALKLIPKKLCDPIQFKEIIIDDFANDDRSDPNTLDIAHNEAVNLDKFYFDSKRGCILSPSRPNNLFWSKHLSNMMQQNYSLEEYFRWEEETVRRRNERLSR